MSGFGTIGEGVNITLCLIPGVPYSQKLNFLLVWKEKGAEGFPLPSLWCLARCLGAVLCQYLAAIGTDALFAVQAFDMHPQIHFAESALLGKGLLVGTAGALKVRLKSFHVDGRRSVCHDLG